MFNVLKPARLALTIKSLTTSLWLLFKSNFQACLLFFISSLIALRNYDPGTFLTGWDTLHPEFNFNIYWNRILDGVWQTHQGLGAVGSQAHASEIPRILILEFMSFFMSMDQLRYAYAFMMLIIGPLGVYFFLRSVALKRFSKSQSEMGAFAGGLLYLLNLGTMQHFYVPLEMFLVHYGFLGWILYTASRFYETGSRRHIASFLLFSILITPQAHTPTLFYSYILNFVVFFGILVFMDFIDDLYDKAKRVQFGFIKSKTGFQRTFLMIIFTLLVNSFWLLPNVYFVINHSASIQESKIHHLFSEEAFLQNKEFGKISDIAILKNFLFNWGEHVGGGQFGELLDEWNLHLRQPYVLGLGYTFFGLICIGLLLAFIRKERYAAPAFLMLFVSIFFLFNVNPPFGFIFLFLQNQFPLFKEAFRFPFTKFSITLMFSYAVFFGYFFAYLGKVVDRFISQNYLAITMYVYLYSMVAFSLVYYMQPAINGNLISPSMRVNIPNRYFKMFDYLYQQNQYGRVADLPIQSFWGWMYYDWDPITKLGYQGAGFLWFGIKQPLLNREFDRWNILNEEYYRDMSLAVYSEDLSLLESTLDKFKVRWILVDESVLSPGSDEKMMFYPQIKELLSKSSKITLDKDFGDGLKIYKYSPEKDFSLIETDPNFYLSDDSIFKEYKDPLFEGYGNYVNTGNKNFPYLGITNFDESLNPKFISSDSENTYFTNRLTFAKLNADSVNDTVQFYVSIKKNPDVVGAFTLRLEDVPGFIESKAYDIDFSTDKTGQIVISLNDNLFTVSLDTIDSSNFTKIGFAKLDPLKTLTFKVLEPVTIDLNAVNYFNLLEKCSGSGNEASYSIEKINDGFKISARNLNACITVNLSDLIDINKIQNNLIQLSIDTNAGGTNPNICILNTTSGLCINRPVKDGTTFGLLDNPLSANTYFLRFIANGSTDTETSVEFKNLNIKTYSTLTEESLDIKQLSKVEGEVFGRLVFKKDTDFSGNATTLSHNAILCSTGSSTFNDSKAFEVDNKFIRYESHGNNLCDSFQFPFAPHNSGYVLEVKARNLEGIPLRICLTNEFSKRCDLYVSVGVSKDFKTHYYLIPPMGEGNGFTVNVSNMIFGSGVSINDLEYISLTPFPYDFLRSVHYDVPMSQNEKLIIYNQAFEPGWVAICGFKLCSAKHVMVNNWANGWIFDKDADTGNIKIVFWPQILEYLGFFLLISCIASIKKFKKEDIYV